MKTNPRSTRGFFTLLAYHERSRHTTAFQSSSARTGTVIGSTNTRLPRIEAAPPFSKPAANWLTQQHRKVAA